MQPVGNSDPVFSSTMRRMSRASYADIWRRGIAKEPLEGEDALFFEIMQQHPEYSHCWEHAAELGDREVLIHGVNPFLHIAIHSVVENQIAQRNPPETDQALFRLTRSGLDRHDALHHILQVLTPLMWDVMQKKVPFDNETYRRRLRAIKP
jgi:hypothetical protein